MKSKSFDYRKVPNRTVPRKYWIKRPILQVTLSSGANHQQVVAWLTQARMIASSTLLSAGA